MNRYTAQILAFLLVVVIAIMMLSLTGIVIWHLLLKDASRYKTFKRLHYVLLASAPLTLMIYNVFSRTVSEPRTTSLWAYVVTPTLIALPFATSLAGLVMAHRVANYRYIRQIVLAILCLLASAGSVYCGSAHYCMDGHLRHGSHEHIEPWIVDGIWLFGIAGAAVIGIRGGFPGARTTGVIAACLILLMVLSQDPLRGLIAIPLVPLSIFHLVAIGIRLNKGEGEQGGGGNALKLPNHPSTAHSTMRATP